MLLSLARRVLVRGPDGNTIWRETSQLCLPKGGKKLTFLSVIALYYFSKIIYREV